jgi:hypothetical protein
MVPDALEYIVARLESQKIIGIKNPSLGVCTCRRLGGRNQILSDKILLILGLRAPNFAHW